MSGRSEINDVDNVYFVFQLGLIYLQSHLQNQLQTGMTSEKAMQKFNVITLEHSISVTKIKEMKKD